MLLFFTWGCSSVAGKEDHTYITDSSLIGGSYSAESLQALKSPQRFAPAKVQKHPSEVYEEEGILNPEAMLELSGDEAERIIEQLEGGSSIAAEAVIAERSCFVDETMDFKARLKLKIMAAGKEAEERKAREADDGRVYTSASGSSGAIKNDFISFDKNRVIGTPRYVGAPSARYTVSSLEEAEDGDEWEEQMLRRGMRVAAGDDSKDTAMRLHTSAKNEQRQAVAAAAPTTRLTADDLELSLAEALNAMRENNLRNERRLETLGIDLSSCVAEEEKLRSALEVKVKMVNDKLFPQVSIEQTVEPPAVVQ
jgi:hypothetical protein